MADNLKPCPFCGGEAEPFNPFGETDGTWTVLCGKCAASVGFEQTPAEAIAAWNARADRTCYDASVDSSAQFYCSACECTVDVPLLWGAVNYCPNCGAKVIE